MSERTEAVEREFFQRALHTAQVMRGAAEKQGYSFSRAGWLASKNDPTIDADKLGRALRRQLRPPGRKLTTVQTLRATPYSLMSCPIRASNCSGTAAPTVALAFSA